MQSNRSHRVNLIENSPLRKSDPRAKLILSLCASTAVMLPLERLAIFMVVYLFILIWAGLLKEAARQVWRLKWILCLLFLLDWWLIGIDLAVVITLRLVLLAGVFTLFFFTTSPSEVSLTLESLHLPYRYAFSISLAFQSLSLLAEEWQSIREAQKVRGIDTDINGWQKITHQIQKQIALTVPAIVLVTKRAWAITEAAYARGFDSPERKPFKHLVFKRKDWIIMISAIGFMVMLFFLRF